MNEINKEEEEEGVESDLIIVILDLKHPQAMSIHGKFYRAAIFKATIFDDTHMGRYQTLEANQVSNYKADKTSCQKSNQVFFTSLICRNRPRRSPEGAQDKRVKLISHEKNSWTEENHFCEIIKKND